MNPRAPIKFQNPTKVHHQCRFGKERDDTSVSGGGPRPSLLPAWKKPWERGGGAPRPEERGLRRLVAQAGRVMEGSGQGRMPCERRTLPSYLQRIDLPPRLLHLQYQYQRRHDESRPANDLRRPEKDVDDGFGARIVKEARNDTRQTSSGRVAR